MLFVDKYRPASLDKNDCHPELAANLKNLATSDDFPHLLFYGPTGAGKKTLIMSLLREIYGPGVEKLKIEPRSFKIATKSEPIEINIIASSYHIEMNPSDCGYYDRVVVQEVIKEIAQSQPLETSLTPQRRPYKIVILSEVDKMTKAAQHALRRTMEKYLATCRLVMTATSHARVTPAVLSRSLALRVARPSSAVLSHLLADVCRRENWAAGTALTPLIADKAERNIRRALLMLEVAKTKSGVQLVKQIDLPDWEVFVQQLAKEIIDEQSPQKLLTLRSKLYELLVHCIPADVIIRRLTTALLERLDADLKVEVTHWAAFYEHRLKSGSKPIFHLEAFIAKCMSLYKSYLIQSFGE